MPSSGLLRHVALRRTDASEEPSASIIRVTRIGEIGTALAVASNRRTLRRTTSISSQRAFVLIFFSQRASVAANVVPSSPFLVTLMMEGLSSSKSSVLTRAKRRNFPEDGILDAKKCSECLDNRWLIVNQAFLVSPPKLCRSVSHTFSVNNA
jgi:hypothetical protein